ncbi:MAG TPA: hypothetical protein VHD31_02415 [Candidatus Paceibacterota bacterium]|nr:hypothetical protein [Candidatus Paceibacterota bacterium]
MNAKQRYEKSDKSIRTLLPAEFFETLCKNLEAKPQNGAPLGSRMATVVYGGDTFWVTFFDVATQKALQQIHDFTRQSAMPENTSDYDWLENEIAAIKQEGETGRWKAKTGFLLFYLNDPRKGEYVPPVLSVRLTTEGDVIRTDTKPASVIGMRKALEGLIHQKRPENLEYVVSNLPKADT